MHELWLEGSDMEFGWDEWSDTQKGSWSFWAFGCRKGRGGDKKNEEEEEGNLHLLNVFFQDIPGTQLNLGEEEEFIPDLLIL